MNTINHNFYCECCGTTEPLFDEEITVTLIGTNGVIEKKVCYECADKMKKKDPRYLGQMTTGFLDPAMQEMTEQRFNAWKEAQKKSTNDFYAHTKILEMNKEILGKRTYTGFVDVTDPCYGSGGFYGYDGKRLPVATGEYTCIAWTMKLLSIRKEEHQEYIATNSFGIYLNGKIPAYDDMARACAVGVDSGTIGIFDVKDDFDLRHWFDKTMDNNDYMEDVQIQDVGLTASVDDGGYGIYVAIENGEIVAVEIRVSGHVARGE